MRHLILGLFGMAFLCVFVSCQKEISVENGSAAMGSLQSAAGDCLPKTVAGAFIAGKPLTDSNYLEVSVNITATGPYLITTDSLNGYLFRASGTFTTTGNTTVRLKAVGTPQTQGINNFTVFFDSSSCDIAVTVLPSGSSTGPATFTMACTSFVPQGSYYKDTTLTTANAVTLQVNVASQGGTYTITTNTVNGYSFSKSGTFGSSGLQTVTLQGMGKPIAAGTDNFIATAGTGTCNFQVTVTVPPVGGGGCTAPTVQGTYTTGTALTASNKVVFTHTYATTGSFTVSTNTVNGYGFTSASASGTAGSPVTITLTGTGSPTAAGTDNFTVNFGDGTTCPFTVTVNPSAPVVNNDHFPLTASSWWSYNDDVTTPPDSVKVTNIGTGSFNGNSYRLFQYKENASPYDSIYYRRNVNDYYEYRRTDNYTIFSFDNPQKGDILFLKEGIATGATWSSATYSGTVTFGGTAIPVNIKYNFTCNDANATEVVNGKTYTNVYKITLQPQFSVVGMPYEDDDLTWTMYYAKGIGLIYLNGTDGMDSYTMQMRNHQVF